MGVDLDKLAEVFHRAWRKHMDLAPPWPTVSDNHRNGVKAGIEAVLKEIQNVPDR